MTKAVLPYNGSSGWSGSDTSKERADNADHSGTTASRQQKTLTMLSILGRRGITARNLSEWTGLHRGTTSGILSNLHKAGRVARLQERRDGCLVYVLPEHVNGREVGQYTPNLSARVLKDVLRGIDRNLEKGNIDAARKRIASVLDAFGEEEEETTTTEGNDDE
jgi:DNA-binding MarR family transcriptional regulator